MKTPATPYNLVIPTEFKAGSTHTLDVVAKFNNGVLIEINEIYASDTFCVPFHRRL